VLTTVLSSVNNTHSTHTGMATPRRDTYTKNSKNMMTVVSNAFLEADQLRG